MPLARATVATPSPGKLLRASIWLAQLAVAGLFCMSGVMKISTPIPELSAMMPWTGQLPATFVRIIGLIDLAGGIGILLPALTRIKPQLTVAAALGCVVLQALAFCFHAMRGEFAVLPLNVVLFALSAFVLWGRLKAAPITPRA
ncbi:DoxX family protein [Ancylobacter sp. WKF20]|uniref:DoxX family protein n=1 Tax=Ancylobacter sp. WKF20 TaxID=3039801 RepID=UPI00243452AA|nr:DoxX family protein [Ancylobacter sp. WKF20]WGD29651.1 DoxX family protein [Ancylobacter sp. WKF20]